MTTQGKQCGNFSTDLLLVPPNHITIAFSCILKRFQLFGDTVNTASRMESTSVAGRIQISQATADLLEKGRKGNWFSPREDKVLAKGKGHMQTYWLDAVETAGTIASCITGDHSTGNVSLSAQEDRMGDGGSCVVKSGTLVCTNHFSSKTSLFYTLM